MLIGRQVTVIGGGIGGLAAALALAQRGAAVTVLEQAPEIAEVGAGLQIGPNGMHVLARLGLADTVLAHATLPRAVEMRAFADNQSDPVVAQLRPGAARQSVAVQGAAGLVEGRGGLEGAGGRERQRLEAIACSVA